MTRLEFEAAAAAAYEHITDAGVLDKIDAVLDGLESDPGQDWLRGHRWSDPPLWGVTVPDRRQDYLVLWATETLDDETIVVVYYVGPDVPAGSLSGETPALVRYRLRDQPKRPCT